MFIMMKIEKKSSSSPAYELEDIRVFYHDENENNHGFYKFTKPKCIKMEKVGLSSCSIMVERFDTLRFCTLAPGQAPRALRTTHTEAQRTSERPYQCQNSARIHGRCLRDPRGMRRSGSKSSNMDGAGAPFSENRDSLYS